MSCTPPDSSREMLHFHVRLARVVHRVDPVAETLSHRRRGSGGVRHNEGIRCGRVVDQRAKHIEGGEVALWQVDGYIADSIGRVQRPHGVGHAVPANRCAQLVTRIAFPPPSNPPFRTGDPSVMMASTL